MHYHHMMFFNMENVNLYSQICRVCSICAKYRQAWFFIFMPAMTWNNNVIFMSARLIMCCYYLLETLSLKFGCDCRKSRFFYGRNHGILGRIQWQAKDPRFMVHVSNWLRRHNTFSQKLRNIPLSQRLLKSMQSL